MADLKLHPCRQCGEPTTKPMYCRRACNLKAFRDRHPEYRAGEYANKIGVRRCSCGAELAKRYRYCAACSMVRRAKSRRKANVPLRHCPDCGAHLDKAQQRCSTCRAVKAELTRRRSRKSPSARANRAKRKALERGQITGAERFDPIEVLARDGWRCHLCGVSTPKRLRGTYDDRAPELDHIIPLAAGGEHSRRNTACACRKCNIAKADRPLGQLLLIA